MQSERRGRNQGTPAGLLIALGLFAGMGFGVVERGWCGIYGMTTLAPMRRQGVASTVLGALAREAGALGATDMYLQVERDNAPATALYEQAGFSYEYGYEYRIRRTK